MAMDTHILDPPNASERADIVRTCLGFHIDQERLTTAQLEEFYNHYTEQRTSLQSIYGPGGGKAWFFPLQSHRQLMKVVTLLQQQGRHATRRQLREELRLEFGWEVTTPSEDVLNSVLDAALRMWLVVNFLDSKYKGVAGGQRCVEWDEASSLSERLGRIFIKSQTELALNQRRLHHHFTAANMARICQIKIEWTSSLEDHLRLDRESKTLWVFDRRHLLMLKAKSSNRNRAPSIDTSSSSPQPTRRQQTRLSPTPFPSELFEETSRTLDLLFPAWDKATRRLLTSKGKIFHQSYNKPRTLDLRDYTFWRDRLLELNEDIFLAPPEGWMQLWLDRRDPQKFWTFWIALSIFILTIVSTLSSIVQTWATLKALHLTERT